MTAGYWVAWRLTYITAERITAVATGEGDPVIRHGRVDPNDRDFGRAREMCCVAPAIAGSKRADSPSIPLHSPGPLDSKVVG
jgi:hypothetical protein